MEGNHEYRSFDVLAMGMGGVMHLESALLAKQSFISQIQDISSCLRALGLEVRTSPKMLSVYLSLQTDDFYSSES